MSLRLVLRSTMKYCVKGSRNSSETTTSLASINYPVNKSARQYSQEIEGDIHRDPRLVRVIPDIFPQLILRRCSILSLLSTGLVDTSLVMTVYEMLSMRLCVNPISLKISTILREVAQTPKDLIQYYDVELLRNYEHSARLKLHSVVCGDSNIFYISHHQLARVITKGTCQLRKSQVAVQSQRRKIFPPLI